MREEATLALAPAVPAEMLPAAVEDLIVLTDVRSVHGTPVHRALPDARAEWARWSAMRDAARNAAANHAAARD